MHRYLAAEGKGRLIQSLKSYLADRGFQATSIFGRTHSLVDLLTRQPVLVPHQVDEAEVARAEHDHLTAGDVAGTLMRVAHETVRERRRRAHATAPPR